MIYLDFDLIKGSHPVDDKSPLRHQRLQDFHRKKKKLSRPLLRKLRHSAMKQQELLLTSLKATEKDA
jgi:hypothetical protein